MPICKRMGTLIAAIVMIPALAVAAFSTNFRQEFCGSRKWPKAKLQESAKPPLIRIDFRKGEDAIVIERGLRL